MRFLKAYLVTFLVFIAMDFVWLTITSSRIYGPEIGGLLLVQPRMLPAILFYAIYMVGLVVLAEFPAAARGRWSLASLYGALFGFVAYATYDLTNLATLKGFSLKVTVADMAWGAVVSSAAATAGYFAARSPSD